MQQPLTDRSRDLRLIQHHATSPVWFPLEALDLQWIPTLGNPAEPHPIPNTISKTVEDTDQRHPKPRYISGPNGAHARYLGMVTSHCFWYL
mmetsp:Transcript_106901/g.184447  ORF Transcript_106901/g.184447 Transcript_106901/m.184447 type:complete len:91 (+) Transcript_106901:472-744(+)